MFSFLFCSKIVLTFNISVRKTEKMHTPPKQESPPAWTQEAYRPPCSKYSLCCPNLIPPGQGTPPSHGTPWPGYPPCQGTPPPPGPCRVPPPPAGPGRVPPPQLPHGILGNVAKHYGIWVPPPHGQTNKVKLLPSRRTTYAGGNKVRHKLVCPLPHCNFSYISPAIIFDKVLDIYRGRQISGTKTGATNYAVHCSYLT